MTLASAAETCSPPDNSSTNKTWENNEQTDNVSTASTSNTYLPDLEDESCEKQKPMPSPQQMLFPSRCKPSCTAHTIASTFNAWQFREYRLHFHGSVGLICVALIMLDVGTNGFLSGQQALLLLPLVVAMTGREASAALCVAATARTYTLWIVIASLLVLDVMQLHFRSDVLIASFAMLLSWFGQDLLMPLLLARTMNAIAAPLSAFCVVISAHLHLVYATYNHMLGIEDSKASNCATSMPQAVWMWACLGSLLGLASFLSTDFQQRSVYNARWPSNATATSSAQEPRRAEGAAEARPHGEPPQYSEETFLAQQQKLAANEEKMQMRDRYIGALSHDFGTPISAMHMALDELTHLLDPADGATEWLVLSLRASLDLIKMIRLQALNYSSLASGIELRPELAPFSVGELMEQVKLVQMFMPRSSGLEVTYTLCPDCPDVLLGNNSWLLMMLINLLSNSFKHAQPTSVAVSVTYASDSSCLVLDVADDGIGVPAYFVKSLFGSFSTTSHSGSGLGLYNVQQMAQALGGATRYFNRKPQSGSIFRLEVPCAVSHEPLPPVAAQQPCSRASEPSSLDYRCSAATASTVTRLTDTRNSDAPTANRLTGTPTTEAREAEASLTPPQPAPMPAPLPASPSVPDVAEPADAPADASPSTLACASTVPNIALAAPPEDSDGEGPVTAASPRDEEMQLRHLLNLGPVLVVEDCPMLQWLTETMLNKWGAAEVLTASDGQEALELISRAQTCSRPALIVMDLQMPRVDGLQATRAIRELELKRQVPHAERLRIIGFSANGDDEAICATAADAGVDAMLCKPMKMSGLLACLRRIQFEPCRPE